MDNERHIAINILLEVNTKNAYSNIALRKALDSHPGLAPHQRAFITEIVKGTLRNLILIDYIIDNFSKKPASKMKPLIREILRISVYQIKWLDKVPDSAAVNEAVKLAKKHGFDSLSGFINGILRNIVRAKEGEGIPLPKQGKGAEGYAKYLSLRYSFPLWLAKALINWLGDSAEAFCKQSDIPPAVTICTNVIKTTRDNLILKLESQGVICKKSDLSDTCIITKETADITQLEAYKQGLFFVMDEGAALAVDALRLRPGQKLIDICAAPGGKSFAASGRVGDSGKVISYDIHHHKVKLMRDMIKHLGLSCMRAEVMDATKANPLQKGRADAVLLDAPCSGFGTIRKKPEIKYTKTMEDVKNLAKLQKQMLAAASSYVKQGGVLVYSTCTVAKEENEDIIQWFLSEFPFKLNNPPKMLLPSDYHDGFYIAEMSKS